MNILKVLTEKRIVGNFGERAAVKMLKKSGYKILEQNFTANDGEIDIIAKNLEYIIFVEVKTRKFGTDNPSEPRAASAVTPEKQRKIIRTASNYIGYKQSRLKLRFDVIEIYYEDTETRRSVKLINHIESAFNKNTAMKGYVK